MPGADDRSASGNRRPDAAERRDLLARVAQGDRAARETLLERHLDLVAAAVQARGGERPLSDADVFQEGTIGLLAAIDAYATSGEGDFESFARTHIASEIAAAEGAEDDARQQDRDLVAAAEAYQRAEFLFRREHGRQATIEEIAALLEWSDDRTEEVATMVDAARREHDEDLVDYLEDQDEASPDGNSSAGPPR